LLEVFISSSSHIYAEYNVDEAPLSVSGWVQVNNRSNSINDEISDFVPSGIKAEYCGILNLPAFRVFKSGSRDIAVKVIVNENALTFQRCNNGFFNPIRDQQRKATFRLRPITGEVYDITHDYDDPPFPAKFLSINREGVVAMVDEDPRLVYNLETENCKKPEFKNFWDEFWKPSV